MRNSVNYIFDLAAGMTQSAINFRMFSFPENRTFFSDPLDPVVEFLYDIVKLVYDSVKLVHLRHDLLLWPVGIELPVVL